MGVGVGGDHCNHLVVMGMARTYTNRFGAKVADWGPVDQIGIDVPRPYDSGFAVRGPGNPDPRSVVQQKADRELFLRDPKAYIAKVRGE